MLDEALEHRIWIQLEQCSSANKRDFYRLDRTSFVVPRIVFPSNSTPRRITDTAVGNDSEVFKSVRKEPDISSRI